MFQEEPNKVEEIIKKDIWGSIKEFLDLGIHIGEGNNKIIGKEGTNNSRVL